MWSGRRLARGLGEILRPPRRWDGHHHAVFDEFPRWRGESDGTFSHDFLGVRTDPRFRPQFRPDPRGPVEPDYPAPQATYFEWVFVLEAVLAARAGRPFTVVELGAGYGPWLATTHAALRARSNVAPRLVGVEMVAHHFEFMKQHLRNNGIDPGTARLIHAAIGDEDGEAEYVPEPEPALRYGQTIHRGPLSAGDTVRVRCVALSGLLAGHERVDLMHVDIQGEERRAIPAAIDEIDARVGRLLVATHAGRTHRTLRSLLLDRGWMLHFDYGLRARVRTEFGDVRFLDGLLAAVNPRLNRSRT